MGCLLIGAALLAPWTWHATQALAQADATFVSLAAHPFHRHVNRCLLILALVGLWPLMRALRIGSRRHLGLIRSHRSIEELRNGLLLGWLSLGLAAVIALSLGIRTLNPEPSALKWISRILSAVLSAVVVSCIEEILFRGALFTAIRRQASFLFAAATTSALYSFVHFFERPARPDAVNALTGFSTLGEMLCGFTQWDQLIPGWINLFLAGFILAWTRERTRRLWMCIGLHAGWIFWLKLYGFATRPVGTDSSAWVGSAKLIDGWLASVVLAGIVLVLHYRVFRHSSVLAISTPDLRPPSS